MQFPVSIGPPPGSYDDIFVEAEDYDDGFAKIVHGTQPRRANFLDTETQGLPAVAELGVRLGWDDEQILIWQNRQLTVPPLPQLPPEPRRRLAKKRTNSRKSCMNARSGSVRQSCRSPKRESS